MSLWIWAGSALLVTAVVVAWRELGRDPEAEHLAWLNREYPGWEDE